MTLQSFDCAIKDFKATFKFDPQKQALLVLVQKSEVLNVRWQTEYSDPAMITSLTRDHASNAQEFYMFLYEALNVQNTQPVEPSEPKDDTFTSVAPKRKNECCDAAASKGANIANESLCGDETPSKNSKDNQCCGAESSSSTASTKAPTTALRVQQQQQSAELSFHEASGTLTFSYMVFTVRRCWTMKLSRVESTDRERIEQLENEVRRLSERLNGLKNGNRSAEDGSLVGHLYSNVDTLQTNMAELISLTSLIDNLEEPVSKTISKFEARIKALEDMIKEFQTKNNNLNQQVQQLIEYKRNAEESFGRLKKEVDDMKQRLETACEILSTNTELSSGNLSRNEKTKESIFKFSFLTEGHPGIRFSENNRTATRRNIERLGSVGQPPEAAEPFPEILIGASRFPEAPMKYKWTIVLKALSAEKGDTGILVGIGAKSAESSGRSLWASQKRVWVLQLGSGGLYCGPDKNIEGYFDKERHPIHAGDRIIITFNTKSKKLIFEHNGNKISGAIRLDITNEDINELRPLVQLLHANQSVSLE